MVNALIRSLRWSYQRVKKRDIFSQSISLTYRGSETRRTIIGGWVTIGMIIILLIYSVYLLDRMFYKKEVSWNQNTKRYNWEDPDVSMVWDETFPNISFYWIFEEGRPSDYYQFADVLVLNRITHPNGTTENRYIENTECKINHLKEKHPNNQYITVCPNVTGLELRNRVDDQYQKSLQIMLSFWPLSQWTSVQNDQVKDHPTTLVEANVPIMGVDLDDIDEPIKQYPPLRSIIELKNNVYSMLTVTMQRNEVYLEDDWFTFFGEVEPVVFYAVEVSSTRDFYLSEEPGPGYMQISFYAQNEIIQYKRKVLTLLEVTGTIGGVFELLEITVGIFIGFYSSYMFKRDIKKDLSDAEVKYREVQESIRKLQQAQQEIMGRFDAEEEKKQSQNQENVSNEHIASPDEELNFNQMRKKIEEIKMRHDQKLNDDLVLEDNKHQMKDTFDNFKESLDCIDIVYSLKTLRLQVDYLLSKDTEYQSEIKVEKHDEVQKDQKSDNLVKPFESLGPKMKRFMTLQKAKPNKETNYHDRPNSFTKLKRYERVQKYLDED